MTGNGIVTSTNPHYDTLSDIIGCLGLNAFPLCKEEMGYVLGAHKVRRRNEMKVVGEPYVSIESGCTYGDILKDLGFEGIPGEFIENQRDLWRGLKQMRWGLVA